MSPVTAIWSAAGGACLALGLMHLLVWWGNRRLSASLWFSGIAMSVAMMAGIESSIAYVASPERFYELHRLGHVSFFFAVVCIVGFIRAYFGTTRTWLLWSLLGLRAAILVLAFIPGPTFNYQVVSSLETYEFLGETLMSPIGVPTAWEFLGNLSGLLLVAYVADAGIRLWRQGGRRERQRALVVTLGVLLFLTSCIINGLLIHRELLQIPYYITLSFLFIVVAMEIELSRDLRHASSIADELNESVESMSLAAEAVQLALWRWEIAKDQIWVSPNGREMFGIPADEDIDLQRFFETLVPEDRNQTAQAIERSLTDPDGLRIEFRVALPNGRVRWIRSLGHVELDSEQNPLRMRGISIDITKHREAESEAARHRAELTHLTRVSSLSGLSGMLAHELVQPLAIILSNAQAAKRMLSKSKPDLGEVDDILDDIIAEDRRANQVIERLRGLVQPGDHVKSPVSLNEIIKDVLKLTRHDLSDQKVNVETDLSNDLPEVIGDAIQLQQLLLNLILNARDAMSGDPAANRNLIIASTHHGDAIRVTVSDEGSGFSGEPESHFESFTTTKTNGLGMGLAICRTICRSHHGRIWAESGSNGGAVLTFELPVHRSETS